MELTREKLIEYLRTVKTFTIPALQKKFDAGYRNVYELVAVMEDLGEVVYRSGILFDVVEKTMAVASPTLGVDDERAFIERGEEEEEDDEEEEEDELSELEAFLEQYEEDDDQPPETLFEQLFRDIDEKTDDVDALPVEVLKTEKETKEAPKGGQGIPFLHDPAREDNEEYSGEPFPDLPFDDSDEDDIDEEEKEQEPTRSAYYDAQEYKTVFGETSDDNSAEYEACAERLRALFPDEGKDGQDLEHLSPDDVRAKALLLLIDEKELDCGALAEKMGLSLSEAERCLVWMWLHGYADMGAPYGNESFRAAITKRMFKGQIGKNSK